MLFKCIVVENSFNSVIVTVIILLVVWEPLSPLRCVLALVLPAAIVHRSLKKKTLSRSGARAGFPSNVASYLSDITYSVLISVTVVVYKIYDDLINRFMYIVI
jgi:hypothetical protein